METMKLWQQVCTTDPAAVKKITGKTYQGDSPKPYWLIQRATEVFGPCGIGWGVNVVSERFERITDTDVLHVAVVSIWFTQDGKRSESIEQMGGTKAAYMTSAGKMMIDEDAGKKSVTDGMVKCLSMIGFAGDIFAGMWNDSKYVEWAAEQYHPKPDIAAILRGISGSISVELLRANFEVAMQMLDAAHHPAIKKATQARKAQLNSKATA